ncbi:Uncharacterized protein Rs2_07486 [Raphanus sativus]|nr:Uncharacterized protein Rs2_07486 [Raphanus sativus]
MTLQLVLRLFHACERLYRIEIVISNLSLYFCFVRFGVSDGEGAVVDGGGALLDGDRALLEGDDGDRALHGGSPRSKGCVDPRYKRKDPQSRGAMSELYSDKL